MSCAACFGRMFSWISRPATPRHQESIELDDFGRQTHPFGRQPVEPSARRESRYPQMADQQIPSAQQETWTDNRKGIMPASR